MDKSSETFKKLKTLVQQYSGIIGPEHIFRNSKADTYLFEDNLRFNKHYFYGGYFLREVLEKIGCRKNETNYDFCYNLFHKIMSEVYRNVKDRNIPIEKTLDNYLTEEDFDFAAKRLEELLKSSRSKFKIILVSNLIELSDIESLQIGNVTVRKITRNYINTLPEEIEIDPVRFGLLSVERHRKKITREEFLDKYHEHVALEVNVEGYHFEDETSPVFYLAIQEIRLFFAYLFACKHFLENVAKGKYKIEVKEMPKYPFLSTETIGLQEYYIRKQDDISYLKKIDTRWAKIILSNKTFVLTKESLDKLSESCHLGNFNTMNQSHDYGEIKSKINRSLDWFLKAILEEDVTDAVISFFISLESLLSTDAGPLTSHTDDMAENIAIMLTSDPDNRYEHKRRFKDVYRLRNKVMHNGKVFSWDEGKDVKSLNYLKIDIVWSVLGILKRLELIREYGITIRRCENFLSEKN